MPLFAQDDSAGGGGDKTENATPKRRAEAEREGKVARSADLSAAGVLFASAIVLSTAGAVAIGEETMRTLRADLSALSSDPLLPAGAVNLVQTNGLHFMLAMLPFVITVTSTATLIGLIQGRGIISVARITPKWTNLDPRNGLNRILGAQGAFTLFKSFVKLVILAFVAWLTLRNSWTLVTGLTATDVSSTLTVLRTLCEQLVVHVSMAFLALAGADYGFQFFQTEQSLRMTKQEVKREMRESEGDPMVKSRIRSLMRAMTRKRMLRDVPKADVVITNPTHIAVALRYDLSLAGAPIVVAMGERKLAERIKSIAREAGVPTIENRPLAQALRATAKVGYPIPAALYAAVAEVLAYVYRRRRANGMGGQMVGTPVGVTV